MSEPTPPPAQSAWTILALLRWTTQFFESKGIASARLDAELLLAHALGCRRIELYARYDEVPAGPPLDRFRELVKARACRVPAKHLVGETEFFSLPLQVTPAVLIPRPETELLVERALEVLPADAACHVADLGTGSGAIAVAIASRCVQARVLATDLSAEALAVARRNVERHGLGDRVELRQGRWFEALAADEAFDAIVSNPPYVARGELEQAMPEVRDHEPRLALDGGADGLDAVRELVAGAAARLRPGGWLLLEIGAGQGPAVRQLGEETGHYETVLVRPDFAGHDRVVSMQRTG